MIRIVFLLILSFLMGFAVGVFVTLGMGEADIMSKNDYGTSHWSSDKVWRRRAKMLHPELESAIDKVIQVLKEERLTRGQMHFVLTKVTNHLIYQKA